MGVRVRVTVSGQGLRLGFLIFSWQTNAEYQRGISYPSDKALTEVSRNLNIFRHNHRGVQEEFHGPAQLRKECVVDLREDIMMIKEYLCKKLGKTVAEVRMETAWSHMAGVIVQVENIGWKRMLAGEQDLRDWLQKAIDEGVLSGDHIRDDLLAAELGIDEGDIVDAPVTAVDADDGAAMGDAGQADQEGDHHDASAYLPVTESDSDYEPDPQEEGEGTQDEVDTLPAPEPPKETGGRATGARGTTTDSSDDDESSDDEPLYRRLPKAKSRDTKKKSAGATATPDP